MDEVEREVLSSHRINNTVLESIQTREDFDETRKFNDSQVTRIGASLAELVESPLKKPRKDANDLNQMIANNQSLAARRRGTQAVGQISSLHSSLVDPRANHHMNGEDVKSEFLNEKKNESKLLWLNTTNEQHEEQRGRYLGPQTSRHDESYNSIKKESEEEERKNLTTRSKMPKNPLISTKNFAASNSVVAEPKKVPMKSKQSGKKRPS